MGDAFERTARAAAAYLAAHAELAAAGVSEERPAAARNLADAWIALTKACAELPAGGPEQAGVAGCKPEGLAAHQPDPEGLPPRSAGHAFLPHPWGKDLCDAKLDEDGRVRTCARPRREHQS